MLLAGVWKRTLRVAIKLELPSSIDFESIEREAMHFDAIGRHDNVVALYGVCLDASQGGLLLVMELCEHGSLETYMRGSRDRSGAVISRGILEVDDAGAPTKVCACASRFVHCCSYWYYLFVSAMRECTRRGVVLRCNCL